MKILFFDAEISKETIPPFINELEEVKREDKEAIVYLCDERLKLIFS